MVECPVECLPVADIPAWACKKLIVVNQVNIEAPCHVGKGLFSETHISKAKRIEMCKSNYPRSEAKWD